VEQWCSNGVGFFVFCFLFFVPGLGFMRLVCGTLGPGGMGWMDGRFVIENGVRILHWEDLRFLLR